MFLHLLGLQCVYSEECCLTFRKCIHIHFAHSHTQLYTKHIHTSISTVFFISSLKKNLLPCFFPLYLLRYGCLDLIPELPQPRPRHNILHFYPPSEWANLPALKCLSTFRQPRSQQRKQIRTRIDYWRLPPPWTSESIYLWYIFHPKNTKNHHDSVGLISEN